MENLPRIGLQHAILRPLELRDARSLAVHGNTESVHRFISDAFPYPFSERDAREFIERVRKSEWPSSGSESAVFGIDINREAVGVASLTRGSLNHRVNAELGYWLHEEYWGRGIMTNAVQMLTPWCFANMDARRVFAPVYAPNRASARVLEKAGYQLEATHRQTVIKNDVVMDELIYALYAPSS